MPKIGTAQPRSPESSLSECSQPDLALAETLPWITPETVATALKEMAAPEMSLVANPAAGSRVYGRIGVIVTATASLATLGAFLQYDRYDTRVVDHGNYFNNDRALVQHDRTFANDGRTSPSGMSAATVLVGGLTLYLRKRSEPTFSFRRASSGTGNSATFTTSW